MAEKETKWRRQQEEPKLEDAVASAVAEAVEPKVLKDKATIVVESQLTEAQKKAYLKRLGVVVEQPVDKNAVSFSVYAKIKGIDSSLHKAMLAYPKAKGVGKATLIVWDKIFKEF